MQSKNLAEIHQATSIISNIGYRLEFLSVSFDEIGNLTVGEKMLNFSKKLVEASQQIDRAIGESTYTEYRQSVESAQSTILAALNACLISDEEIKDV